MSDKPQPTVATPPDLQAPAAVPSGKAVKLVVCVIVVSLIWYLLADRFNPYTQQARVQAYVVSVAAEASGRVTRVLVHNNQEVRAGDVLFEIDGDQYRIAVDRGRADLESTRRQVGAGMTVRYIGDDPPRPEEFFIGDTVGFTDKHLNERVGTVVRLNSKTTLARLVRSITENPRYLIEVLSTRDALTDTLRLCPLT